MGNEFRQYMELIGKLIFPAKESHLFYLKIYIPAHMCCRCEDAGAQLCRELMWRNAVGG